MGIQEQGVPKSGTVIKKTVYVVLPAVPLGVGRIMQQVLLKRSECRECEKNGKRKWESFLCPHCNFPIWPHGWAGLTRITVGGLVDEEEFFPL